MQKVVRRKNAKILRPVFAKSGSRCVPGKSLSVAFRRDDLFALLVREARKKAGFEDGAVRHAIRIRSGIAEAPDSGVCFVVELERVANVVPLERPARRPRAPKKTL